MRGMNDSAPGVTELVLASGNIGMNDAILSDHWPAFSYVCTLLTDARALNTEQGSPSPDTSADVHASIKGKCVGIILLGCLEQL